MRSLSSDAVPQNASSFASSVAAIGRASVGAGEGLIVPSDRALLRLNADALADLAVEGGVDPLLHRLSPSELDDIVDPDPPSIVITEDRRYLRLTEIDGQLMLNERPIVVVTTLGDVTVVVVDGIIEP